LLNYKVINIGYADKRGPLSIHSQHIANHAWPLNRCSNCFRYASLWQYLKKQNKNKNIIHKIETEIPDESVY